MINNLVNQLLELEDSTTLLLEDIRGMSLTINVENQSEEKVFERTIIKRVVKLYFDSYDEPALYCISYLDKDNLTGDEYKFLMKEEMPIGKLFMKFNDIELIRKKNIEITMETNEEICKLLNVKSAFLYKKEYDYWIGDRKIGKIIEIFNEESLNRICQNV